MKFRTNKLLTIVFIVTNFLGCQKFQSSEEESSNVIKLTEEAEHPLPQVVLSSKLAYEYDKASNNKNNSLGYQPEFENYWDIPPSVVREVYEALPEHIKSSYYTFEEYGLQYMGVVDKNGKKLVSVVGFCIVPKDWLHFVYV